jgi:hypothetical protein
MAKISNEEILLDIRRAIQESGGDKRIVTYRQLGRYSITTILSRFGSWDNAINAAQDETFADMLLPRTTSSTAKIRKCLGPGCTREFLSSWAGHRICPQCRENMSGQIYGLPTYSINWPQKGDL